MPTTTASGPILDWWPETTDRTHAVDSSKRRIRSMSRSAAVPVPGELRRQAVTLSCSASFATLSWVRPWQNRIRRGSERELSPLYPNSIRVKDWLEWITDAPSLVMPHCKRHETLEIDLEVFWNRKRGGCRSGPVGCGRIVPTKRLVRRRHPNQIMRLA